MSDTNYHPKDRRPIASRDLAPIKWLATKLANSSFSPNQISVAGMVSALIAAVCFWLVSITASDSWLLWIAAAIFVQFRLLANVLDGMVAIAKQTASPLGELYNEVPDRLSDSFILIGFGLAPGGSVLLGSIAALTAMFTAYIRAIGKTSGSEKLFCGPMAKPQRMFFVTVAAIICAFFPPEAQCESCGIGDGKQYGLVSGVLLLIIIGSLVTAQRRLRHVAEALKK